MTAPQTALSLFEEIQSGQRRAVEVLEETFARIEATDQRLGAFNTLTRDLAHKTAQEVDRRVKAGESLPLLAGVPLAIKDNINIQGTPTTCSSKMLANYISPYNATVFEKVDAHLMPVVGKTNMDEFAMGSSNENSATHMTRNPWDLERVPGGSSGGSAVSVAAAQVPLSLGSDTGGSVRQPASLCGIVGLKPTYGLVSRFGLVAFASSLDQISPFGRNVADAAAMLQVIAGSDPKDSTSIQNLQPVNYLEKLKTGIEGLRIGMIAEFEGEGMQLEVCDAFHKAVKTLESLGAKVSKLSIPSIEYAIASYYIIATAEASSNLARYDGVRYGLRNAEADEADIHTMYRKTRAQGFGDEVKRRIMLGTFCLSSGYYDAYYGKAQKVRQLLRQEFDKAWQEVDVLICPTSPTTAFKIGEKASDPVSMYLSDIATIPVNLVGIPGISVPCGFDHEGLPIGLQILGPHLTEERILQVAQAYEQASGFANLTPRLG